MGKQFNIKDTRAIELAQDLAARKGTSVTAAIRDLLEDERRQREEEIAQRIAEMTVVVERIRAKIPPHLLKLSSKEWMDAIYDEGGLPET